MQSSWSIYTIDSSHIQLTCDRNDIVVLLNRFEHGNSRPLFFAIPFGCVKTLLTPDKLVIFSVVIRWKIGRDSAAAGGNWRFWVIEGAIPITNFGKLYTNSVM